MTSDADGMMTMDRTTAIQRRPYIFNLCTKRIRVAMSEGSHPWETSSMSNQLFPLVEDSMRHLKTEQRRCLTISFIVEDKH